METIDKYLIEGMKQDFEQRRADFDKRTKDFSTRANNVAGAIQDATSNLIQAISRQNERAYKVHLNTLESLVKELRKTSIFLPRR